MCKRSPTFEKGFELWKTYNWEKLKKLENKFQEEEEEKLHSINRMESMKKKSFP